MFAAACMTFAMVSVSAADDRAPYCVGYRQRRLQGRPAFDNPG